MAITNLKNRFLALDIGNARIGIALNLKDTRISKPYGYLQNDEKFIENLKDILNKEEVNKIVCGLPRGLSGQETEQTKYVRHFIENLKDKIDTEIAYQDEALTSVNAEEILKQTNKDFEPGDIDAYAASLILQDYLDESQDK